MKDEACIEAMFGDKRVWNGECGPMFIDVALNKRPEIGTLYTQDGIEYRFGLVWTGLVWEAPQYPLNGWGFHITPNAQGAEPLKKINGLAVATH